MSELDVNVLIANIYNGMSNTLDDEQLKQLKDVLYISLHNVDISNKCYDLTTTVEGNDTKKIEYFIASKKIARLSDKSVKQYVNAAIRLRIGIGKNFEDIEAIDIKFFLTKNQMEYKWKDSTLSNYIYYLRAFYNFLKKENLIEDNPMDRVEQVHVEDSVKTVFSSVDMEKLRCACRQNTRSMALIEFLNATGIRVAELCSLYWRDLDMVHLSLIIVGKGRKIREVLFTEKAGFYLLRYMDERMTKENRTKEEIMNRPLFAGTKRSPKTKDYERLTDNGVRSLLKRIGKMAEVYEITPHKFRRTFATNAMNHGMALEVLSKLMGHSQYDTTLGYAQLQNTLIEHSYRTNCDL